MTGHDLQDTNALARARISVIAPDMVDPFIFAEAAAAIKPEAASRVKENSFVHSGLRNCRKMTAVLRTRQVTIGQHCDV
jgi:hypothetical protein